MEETYTDQPLESMSPLESSVEYGVRVIADELIPLFYGDLKRLAQGERRRFGAGPTMQTTALVNEAYLKLRSSRGWNDDSHFLRAAALAMRHALVNQAVARMTAKRGDGVGVLPLSEALDVPVADDATTVALNDALGRLAQHSLRMAQIVECRYFAGFNEIEAARALAISERTVRRDWTLARAWLHEELANDL